jgi:hypothetical protein
VVNPFSYCHCLLRRLRDTVLLALVSTTLLVAAPSVQAQWAQVSSPDGRIVLTLDRLDLGATVARYPSGQYLYYSVTLDGATVLDWSPLGITLSDRAFTQDLALVSTSTVAVSDSYTLAVGKRSDLAYTANALTVAIDNTAGDRLELQLRVFDDGVALRYHVPGTSAISVLGESTGFRVPAGATGYLAPAQAPATYEPSYEVPYVPQPAGTSLYPEGYYFPALFALPGAANYLLLHEAGLEETYAASRLDGDATDNVYLHRFPSPGEGDVANPVQPATSLPLTTPWRMVAIGSLASIVETDLVTHLASPLHTAFSGDTSWIAPGKAAWSWWSQGTGTPALQREYVDFAAEFGWDYIVVDEGWDQWAAGELLDLVQYAAAQDIRVFVWYNSGGSHNTIPLGPRDLLDTPAQMQAEFAQLAQWGVAGVKIDFFRSDKQARIAQYRALLEAAAQHNLLVNFHGSTVPRGWHREFPNLVTSEAVLGAEYYKWLAGPTAMDNVRLVFTRNVVGSMDYTPLTFDAALTQQGISHAHQLALAGLFESALQVFADQADSDGQAGYRALFTGASYVADYLAELPTTWDETLLLEGSPDSHAVIARRSGERWYVSGINGEATARTVSVVLGDFANNFYSAQLIEQGATPDALVNTLSDLNFTSTLNVTLAPRGGFVLVLKPKKEQSPFKDAPWDPTGTWRMTWLGYLNDSVYPLILHREHDWMFAFNDDPDAMWLWSTGDGWWWTSQSSYPQVYDATTGHLLYYIEGTDDPRWFYDVDLGEWISRP